MSKLTPEQIADGVLAACEIDPEAKVYGSRDCYAVKDLLEVAVEQSRRVDDDT